MPDVIQHLDPGTALIEYSSVDWNSSRYVAYVIRSDADPQLIDLGSSGLIRGAVAILQGEINRAPRAIAQLGETEAGRRYHNAAKRVYDLVFASLERAIGDAAKLYIAPDAALSLVPFGILVDSNREYLLQRYDLSYLGSGKDVVRWNTRDTSSGQVVILADPSFDLARVDGRGNDQESGASHALAQRSYDLAAANWSPLPGTRLEADEVSRQLLGQNVQVYAGEEATEGIVKSSRAPMILHIATHGFFLDSERGPSGQNAPQNDARGLSLTEGGIQPPPQFLESPLLRSGLVFAGANRLGSRQLADGEDDGILTALEVSGLNLWGTDLVVLSACETGLGEVQNGEGVFGLRRAFHLAGARTVVMSLWSVPDKETAWLMQEFYRRMNAGEGKARALQNAQLAMMNERREKQGAAHPFYWGAFVSVGEP